METQKDTASKTRWIGIAFLLFPYIEPQYVMNVLPVVHSMFVYLKYISVIVTICLLLFKWRKPPSRIIYLILIYQIILIVCTIANSIDAYSTITGSITLIVFCLAVDNFSRRRPYELIHALSFILCTYMFINFVTIIFYPNGLYTVYSSSMGYVTQNWFLGYKGPEVRVILPAAVLSMIDSHMKYGHLRIKDYLIIAIVLITEFMVKSSTGIVGVAVFIILYTIFINNKKLKYFTIMNVFLCILCIDTLLIIFQQTKIFSFIIVNILNKDLTLTYRTNIWSSVVKYIIAHKFLGAGTLDMTTMSLFFYVSHPHNYILYIMFQTGIPGFIVMWLLFLTISKKQHQSYNERISKIMLFLVTAILVMSVDESLTEMALLLPIYVLIFNLPHFFGDKGGEKKTAVVMQNAENATDLIRTEI